MTDARTWDRTFDPYTPPMLDDERRPPTLWAHVDHLDNLQSFANRESRCVHCPSCNGCICADDGGLCWGGCDVSCLWGI